jgi:hypothetical protein
MTPDELPADMEARTPAPEGEAWTEDAELERRQADYERGFRDGLAASPVVPAPEGVFVSETCEGEVCWCGKPAVRKVGEEFADDEPNPNRHNLTRYICAHHFAELMGPAGARSVGIAPVVPVGSGEAVARATCQDCGGHIEGWICQSCDRQFRENDAGNLVFEDQPVVPVGVSREVVENLRRQRDHPTSDTLGFTTIRTCDADAILKATDTGRE